MRGVWAVVLLGAVSVVWAQEGPSPAELRRMYDDAISQLRAAQDRKNELAVENETLARRVSELEAKARSLESRNAQLESDAAGYARRTWQLRSTAAAWEAFLRRNPRVERAWNEYLSFEALPGGSPSWFNPVWPLPGNS